MKSKQTSERRRADTSLLIVTGIIWLLAIGAAAFAFTRTTSAPASASAMVVVPAGDYHLGLDDDPATYGAERVVALPAFYIDRGEVTNGEYATYAASTGRPVPPDWPNGQVPAGESAIAVDGISLAQAQQYCASLGKRLPSEAEWEAAGRGVNGQLLPWPGEPDRFATTGDADRLALLTSSQFGVEGLRGGVWEWVADPYDTPAAGMAIVRGGSASEFANLAYRQTIAPLPTAGVGFRCAADNAAEGTAALRSPIVARDDFSSASSGWATFESAAAALSYDSGGTLRLSILEPRRFALVSSPFVDTDQTEVAVTARIDGDAGDYRYGLAAAIDADGSLLFLLEGGGTGWSVQRQTVDAATGAQVLDELDAGSSPTADGTTIHRLTVRLVDGEVVFAIDGELVAELTLEQPTAGRVGLYAETLDAAEIDVFFDDIVVRSGPGLPLIDRNDDSSS